MTALFIVIYLVSFFIAAVLLRISTRRGIITDDDQDIAFFITLFLPPVMALGLGAISLADWIIDGST